MSPVESGRISRPNQYEEMIRPRLSFCIPTYNRGAFIGETLLSILAQCNETIEIVIVDGASTDNTPSVVASLQESFDGIRYHRGVMNEGVDRDMATAVELARGEYCWLMSSDDLLKDGAVNRMLKEIESNDDIYLCDVTLCDRGMRPIRDTQYLSKKRNRDRYDLSDRRQLLSYFSAATSNNALFCYMSAIIFRRANWIRRGFVDAFSRTGYAHVYSLFCCDKTPYTVKYVPVPLVANRAGNDSFTAQGIEKRYMLDFVGYRKLADNLFANDTDVRRQFLLVMTKEHRWYRIAKLRAAISKPRWREIRGLLREFGYSKWTLALAQVAGSLSPVIKGLDRLNEHLARNSIYRKLRAWF